MSRTRRRKLVARGSDRLSGLDAVSSGVRRGTRVRVPCSATMSDCGRQPSQVTRLVCSRSPLLPPFSNQFRSRPRRCRRRRHLERQGSKGRPLFLPTGPFPFFFRGRVIECRHRAQGRQRSGEYVSVAVGETCQAAAVQDSDQAAPGPAGPAAQRRRPAAALLQPPATHRAAQALGNTHISERGPVDDYWSGLSRESHLNVQPGWAKHAWSVLPPWIAAETIAGYQLLILRRFTVRLEFFLTRNAARGG